MIKNTPPTILVTFGAGRTGWRLAAKRLSNEGICSGIFDTVCALDENWLRNWDDPIYRNVLNIRRLQGTRGFGYWCWKPSVLLWADLHFPSHQILYIDAGSQISTSNKKDKVLKEWLETSWETEGLAWTLLDHSEEEWTKREIFSRLDISVESQKTFQVQSGFICLPPDNNRRHFLAEWRKIALEEGGFYFTDELREKQSSIFIENRHDQSVFSCLWKQYSKRQVMDVTGPEMIEKSPVVALRNNSALSLPANDFHKKINLYSNLVWDKVLFRK
jgi:hypothetical protein